MKDKDLEDEDINSVKSDTLSSVSEDEPQNKTASPMKKRNFSILTLSGAKSTIAQRRMSLRRKNKTLTESLPHLNKSNTMISKKPKRKIHKDLSYLNKNDLIKEVEAQPRAQDLEQSKAVSQDLLNKLKFGVQQEIQKKMNSSDHNMSNQNISELVPDATQINSTVQKPEIKFSQSMTYPIIQKPELGLSSLEAGSPSPNKSIDLSQINLACQNINVEVKE